MAKKKKERQPKVEVKTHSIRGKVVRGYQDGEPVANVVKLSAPRLGETYLTSDPTKPTPSAARKSVRAHLTEQSAIGRFSKRFPRITPKLSKKL